jgi:hypothetical protein
MTPGLIVATSVASGVLGSIVTTYGTQAKERRTVRTEVRTCFQRVEQLTRHKDVSQQYYALLLASLDDLEGAMLAAGMPYYIAAFYRKVQLLAYATYFTTPPGERDKPTAHWLIAVRVAHRTATILVNAIWHPLLSAPTRRLRVRRLRRILDNGMPERTRMHVENQQSLREWERDILRGSQKPAGNQGHLPEA